MKYATLIAGSAIACAVFLSCSQSGKEKKLAEAMAAYSSGDLTRALQLADELGKDFGAEEAYLMAGKIHYFERRFEKAESSLRSAVNADKNNLDAVYWLAKTLSLKPEGRAEAASLLDGLLKKRSSDAEAWLLRGFLFEDAKNPQGAFEAYRRVVEIAPYLAQAHDRMARMYETSEMDNSAAEHRRRRDALLAK